MTDRPSEIAKKGPTMRMSEKLAGEDARVAAAIHGFAATDRLSQIEQRLAAATPGPWWWRNTAEPYLQGARTRVVMAFRRMGTQGAQPQFRDEHGLLVDAGKANLNAFPDAALIAHAPADLAALVKFAREVEAANARYMEGAVGGVSLSVDIHAAVLELHGRDPLDD